MFVALAEQPNTSLWVKSIKIRSLSGTKHIIISLDFSAPHCQNNLQMWMKFACRK
ncbi:hypothetical protein PSTT_14600 [Puccinia striiformis]|uniref:Uncharacterized protein n=2 Tax=Puccinia striiformis TaxID=27350 RepID=A0A0L0VPX0_9BASI|nr:hypothetical protein PSTG_05432 [Puccinia striiformis f. sp. tritici PST-78]POV98143.1 hypothetical protein PSTT_14600 [Puccinia striiformis]